MSSEEMVREFVQSKADEERKLILDFAKRIVELELLIKEHKEDIKIVKQEAKDEGVLVKNILKCIVDIKKSFKPQKDSEEKESEFIRTVISEDEDLLYKIRKLSGE